ncbi:Uncharacterized protein FKW44_005443 [Caligus rogercresseyi]|uniref:Uncharacterized protein n=1 Tax=Caligus rogercresseyi TaxID=217165 RepID=A0A7T8KC05_CALRO|nr:Uncharacterized protein FKW44_005443 [Caligus rogercresseyi]
METPDFRSYFLIRSSSPGQSTRSTGTCSLPDLSTLQRWHTEFNKGVFALEKKPRPGRPQETRTEENVVRVKCLVEDNPRMATRQVAAEVFLPTIYNCFQASDGGFRAPKPPQRPAERLSPHVGQCTSPHYHRYQGVPDPEGRGTGETVTLLTDLNLCDRFLFRKLKHLLREDEFGGHEEATLAVQRAMRRVSEDELYDQLRKLRGHCHDIIAVGGDYVY